MIRVCVLVCMLLLLPFVGHAKNADVEVSESVYNFGHVGLDFTIYHTYVITNVGTAPLQIDSVRANCDCTRIATLDSIVQPGQSTSVILMFTTTDFFGPNNKFFSVYTNSPTSPVLRFNYQAVVGQWFNAVKPDPISLFFLPAHTSKQVAITNRKFNHIKLQYVDQSDTTFTVSITSEKARRGEQAVATIDVLPSLPSGTYFANVRFQVVAPDAEPMYLTIPIKIVRY